MLSLMNQVRISQKLGLVSLYQDSALNSIAQAHSNDMVARNFFSHNNPDGLTPQQRAKNAGFNYSVGENIAMNVNLTAAHNSLMASPPHFANTITKDWTRAGVGIAYKGVYVYITILFSSRDFTQYPLTATERSQMMTSIKTYITTSNTNVKT